MRELVETDAPSGFETALRKIIEKELDSKRLEKKEDKLGNLFFMKEGDSPGPTMMIAAHMDEIGMIVSHVDKNGFIRFDYLGGFLDQVVLSQRVTVWTKKGPIAGVIGTKAPHSTNENERSKVIPREKMFIDIGVNSREEANQLGIRIGDPIAWKGELIELQNDKISGKAFDNRLLVYILIEVLKRVDNFSGKIIGTFTVMEEVGLRGARTAAFQVDPDFALSLDIALAGDHPNMSEEESPIKLGAGPTIMMACGSRRALQGGLITHPKVKEFLIDIAEKNNIPCQLEIMRGGSVDGSAIALSKGGIPTGNVGIPTRYVHSPVEVACTSDIDAGIRLLLLSIQNMKNYF
ncbi:MAG: M42 family metallopeptidase [Candidatus Helarchaeales archaeon]